MVSAWRLAAAAAIARPAATAPWGAAVPVSVPGVTAP